MLISSHIAAAQAVLGHEVHIMAYRSTAEGQQRIAAENHRLTGFDRVTLHLLPQISWPERILGHHARQLARNLVPQMDALHIHGIWEPQLLHAAHIARQHHKPYIVLLHGMLLPWSMSRGVWKKRAALFIGARKMLDHAILQFGSADEQRSARALGFTGPGAVIPNGCSPEEFTNLPASGTIRTLHPQLMQDPYVLFLGRLHEQKGVDLLVAAFQLVLQRLPHTRLMIAGPDYGRSSQIQVQIQAAGIGDRLLMTGPIFGTEKLAALRDAACFCLPSRHEGFSLAVLEALACRTPVVISPECHFPEVAEAGAGLIPPLEPAAIAESICHLLSNADLRNHMADAAQQLVFTRYTWAKVAEQIVDAYSLKPYRSPVQHPVPSSGTPGEG